MRITFLRAYATPKAYLRDHNGSLRTAKNFTMHLVQE